MTKDHLTVAYVEVSSVMSVVLKKIKIKKIKFISPIAVRLNQKFVTLTNPN